jgi:glutaconate CoA-transferase subunit B
MTAAKDYTLAELCITAAAEAWRDAGEVLASGLGLVPRLAVGLARLTFSPDLQMTDAEAVLVAEPVPVGKRGDYRLQVEGWMPFRKVFDVLWSGRRHAMTMPTQIDRFGQINISYIGGDFAKPKVQLLGVRGIPGNTINHPCSFFVTDHSKRSFVERVDMVSGAGYDPARWQAGVRADFHDLRLVVTNLAVLDFGGPAHAMRIRSLHPGVTAEQVDAATSFPLTRAADLHETPAPTAEQLRLIRTVLDPHDLRATVFK